MRAAPNSVRIPLVACPFFMPVERLGHDDWVHPPRLPLGDPFRGFCHAQNPPEPCQRELCNCGYARGRCDRFPASAEADAVRFSVVGEESGRLRVIWVLEKDHAPSDHGLLEYAGPGFVVEPSSVLLKAQAEVFIQGYLRRRA